MSEVLKHQLYFFDVIAFLILAALLFAYLPGSPRFYTGMTLATISLLLWIAARIQLGLSFSVQAQARKLVTTGLYSRFRNPIYLFAQVAWFGLAIAWGHMAGFIAAALMVPMQMARAKREEEVLEQAFGEEYRAYKARTLF